MEGCWAGFWGDIAATCGLAPVPCIKNGLLDAVGTGLITGVDPVVGKKRFPFEVVLGTEVGPMLNLCWLLAFKFSCVLKLCVIISKVGCGVIVTPNGPVWTGVGFCAGVTNGFMVGWDLAVLCVTNVSLSYSNIILLALTKNSSTLALLLPLEY